MFYYVEIVNGKIQNKGRNNGPPGQVLNEGQLEVSEEIYNQILYTPADFTTDENGQIISIINGPEPHPKIVRERADPEKVMLCRAVIALDNEIEALKNKITILEAGEQDGA